MRISLLLLSTSLALGCATPATESSDRVLAHVERTTPDGKDHYTFEFREVDDGAIATLVGSPLGYPLFESRGCALDDYLAVAADDEIVPIELRRACTPVVDPTPVRVVDLRTGTAFEPPARSASATTGPYCTRSGYDNRYNALLAAAKEVATKTVNTQVCDKICARQGNVCTIWTVDENGDKGTPVGLCEPQTVDEGDSCCVTKPGTKQVQNTACIHDVVGWGSYGAWLDWERNTPYGVSRLQAEVSTCTEGATTVFFWQSKRDEASAWSDTHYVNLYGPSYWMFMLTAPHGSKWGGAKYRVHANGPAAYPMLAGAMMEGIDHDKCPTGLFL